MVFHIPQSFIVLEQSVDIKQVDWKQFNHWKTYCFPTNTTFLSVTFYKRSSVYGTESNYDTKDTHFPLRTSCFNCSTNRYLKERWKRDIWKWKVKNFGSFMAYNTETKHSTDLWKQAWSSCKVHSDKLKKRVFLNLPGELLVQVVRFRGVEFYSHVKAVRWANWKAEQNKSSEHVRMCH